MVKRQKKKTKPKDAPDPISELLKTHDPNQAEFARYVGCDPAVINRLCKREVLTPGTTGLIWMREYFAYHKGVNAGRRGSGYFT
jgi:hypothetical protein